MQWIWEAYNKNTVTIKGDQCHINGNFRLLLQDDNITETAKTILNGWIRTTENVPGCQALRKKIGHILFGFRVIYGESIFCDCHAKSSQFCVVAVSLSYTQQ